MYKERLIPDELLLQKNTLTDKIKVLFDDQVSSWQMFADGWKGFQSSMLKTFEFDTFSIKIQFNPTRLVSSSAKVDPKTIAARKCFLCLDNLPADQRGILFEDNYLVLCNPAPIFNEHYTVSATEHREQKILSNLSSMLNLSKQLERKYTVFYNGPRCGASAPDHFHFQVCPSNHLVTEKDLKNPKVRKEIIFKSIEVSISYLPDYLRNTIHIQSNSEIKLIETFNKFYKEFQKLTETEDEPLMNVFAYFENGNYNLVIFPREKHRPAMYFFEGDDKVLISPGCVDMAGTLITPVQKDFEQINAKMIIDIFKEVSMDNYKFKKLTEKLI